jgi:hypothetical protein
MKRLLAPFLLLAVTSLLASCGGDQPPPRTQHRPAYTQPPPETGSEPSGEVPPETKPDREKHDTENSSPVPKNNPPPAQVGNYEYGKPVPGKPGFVTSPYEPYQGYIDVRGFPPGTEVKDPYTGKVFLVPAQ